MQVISMYIDFISICCNKSFVSKQAKQNQKKLFYQTILGLVLEITALCSHYAKQTCPKCFPTDVPRRAEQASLCTKEDLRECLPRGQQERREAIAAAKQHQ